MSKFAVFIAKGAPHAVNTIGGMGSAWLKKSVAETVIDAGEQAFVKRDVRDIDFANAIISGMPLPSSAKDALKSRIDVSLRKVDITDESTDVVAAEFAARQTLGAIETVADINFVTRRGYSILKKIIIGESIQKYKGQK